MTDNIVVNGDRAEEAVCSGCTPVEFDDIFKMLSFMVSFLSLTLAKNSHE